jgi:hypothetical protein
MQYQKTKKVKKRKQNNKIKRNSYRADNLLTIYFENIWKKFEKN